MWLRPLLSPVSRALAWTFYQIRYAGEPVPARGPVLLVANHPNSLLDPILVIAAAQRPVRFLAKAPLFDDPRVSWAVKAAGAIPVYRRHDDGARMERNVDAFRAAYAVLAHGGAVGIFPEGISHNEPSLTPLKTGAARLALGTAHQIGRDFPVIPIGMVMREKDVFRSSALVVRGAPVPWSDLAMRGGEDAGAVRLLTDRIDAALRTVTVNLDDWEDRPLVESAVEIWESEQGVPPSPAERVSRLQVTTAVLSQLRATGDAAGVQLIADVAGHQRRLHRLRLRPRDLRADVRLARGVSWAARRLHLLGPPQVAAALAGYLLFWPPYRLTGWIVSRFPLDVGERSTWKLFVGMASYLLWVACLAIAAGAGAGAGAGLATLAAVPAIGLLGLAVRDRWRHAWSDARRFVTLRSRRSLIEDLAHRQHELGVRLDAAWNAAANAAP